MAECLEAECTLPVRARGLCNTHYYYNRRHGTLPPIVAVDRVARFWARVDRSGGGSACWPWTAAINGNGYGSTAWKGRICTPHRIAYELLVGPIPDGMDLDHLCHTRDQFCRGGKTCPHRRCANPAHLEPVPGLVNVMRGRSPHAEAARQTHCAQGHEFTPENTRIYPSRKQRVCLTCKRSAARETQQRKGKKHYREYMRAYRAKKRVEQT